jgi:hypothetical protein
MGKRNGRRGARKESGEVVNWMEARQAVITTTSLLIRERKLREREQLVVPVDARMRWTGWGHDGMSVTCVGNRWIVSVRATAS